MSAEYEHGLQESRSKREHRGERKAGGTADRTLPAKVVEIFVVTYTMPVGRTSMRFTDL